MKPALPLSILAVFTLMAAGAGVIEQSLAIESNTADLTARFLPPSAAHLLGTDELGRDIFIRLLYGAQISLGVGFAAAIVTAMIGTLIGMTSGYVGGRIDSLMMRMTDFLISLPLLPLLIILSAVDFSKLGFATDGNAGIFKIIFLISLTGWTTVARLTRTRTMSLKQMDFITAAHALGVGNARIVARHILPNLLSTVIVATALSVGHFILVESVLSFLGLGIQPPLPSWGNMLTNAQENIWDHAALALYPGALILMTVLAFNFLGDSLQASFDPKEKR